MPPLALAEGVGPSICRFGYPNVPRYHVATINQRLTAKIHFFLISEHTFLFFPFFIAPSFFIVSSPSSLHRFSSLNTRFGFGL